MPRRVHDLIGVGPVLAERILHRFGGRNADGTPARDHTRALDLVRNHPHLLTEVRGIGRDTALAIARANFGSPAQEEARPTARRAQRSPYAFPRLPGIGPTLTDRIVRTLGQAEGGAPGNHPGDPRLAYQRLKDDPYALLRVPGIGYLTASRIATTVFHIPITSQAHNEHGNQHVLQRRGGALPIERYRRERAKLNLAPQLESEGVFFDNGFAWLPDELEAERLIATWATSPQTNGTVDDRLDDHDLKLIRRHGLNDQQAHAIERALQSRVCLLTGGAGTGKTTTIAALMDIERQRGRNVHVMTLAGKSAERVTRACQRADVRLTDLPFYGHMVGADPTPVDRAAGMVYVTTIHRGLRATGRGDFLIEQLAADVVIVDEASMVPNLLLAEILRRIKPTTRVILVGDPAQLPPIGYGSPFEDLLRIALPHEHLTQNYRQADQESIHHFANAIRNRDAKPPFLSAPGLSIQLAAQPDHALAETIRTVLKRPPTGDAEALTVLQWQAVSSTNKLRTHLNAVLQDAFNPDGEPLARLWDHKNEQQLRQGDKVVVIRNDYELDVMNGQTGIVVGPGRAKGALLTLIDGKNVEFAPDLVTSHLRLGYAITVHKAQGSSWHTVVSVEDGAVWGASNRLYYTTCTRAEHHMVFITTLDRQAWWRDVVQPEPPRHSTLLSRLHQSPKPTTPLNGNPHTREDRVT